MGFINEEMKKNLFYWSKLESEEFGPNEAFDPYARWDWPCLFSCDAPSEKTTTTTTEATTTEKSCVQNEHCLLYGFVV